MQTLKFACLFNVCSIKFINLTISFRYLNYKRPKLKIYWTFERFLLIWQFLTYQMQARLFDSFIWRFYNLFVNLTSYFQYLNYKRLNWQIRMSIFRHSARKTMISLFNLIFQHLRMFKFGYFYDERNNLTAYLTFNFFLNWHIFDTWPFLIFRQRAFFYFDILTTNNFLTLYFTFEQSH